MKKAALIVMCVGFLMFVSCGKKAEEAEETAAADPERIQVQHILIAFGGAIPSKPEITRTIPEAEALAKEILERARKGDDFDALVKEFTDDQYPGIYSMSNVGVTPNQGAGEYPREGMVKAFGDVSFGLAVGEIGMTEYSVDASPFGWHIIKRLK